MSACASKGDDFRLPWAILAWHSPLQERIPLIFRSNKMMDPRWAMSPHSLDKEESRHEADSGSQECAASMLSHSMHDRAHLACTTFPANVSTEALLRRAQIWQLWPLGKQLLH